MDFSNAKKGDVCYTREDTPLLFVRREPDGSLLFVNPETNEWIGTDSNGVDPHKGRLLYVAPPGAVDLKSLPAGTRLRDRSGAIWQLQGQHLTNEMYNYKAKKEGDPGFTNFFTRGGFFQLYRAPHENDLVEVVAAELDLSKACIGTKFKDRRGYVWTLESVGPASLYQLSTSFGMPLSLPVPQSFLFHKSGRLVGGLNKDYSNDLIEEVIDLSGAPNGAAFMARNGGIWVKLGMWESTETPYLMGLLKPGTKESYRNTQCYPQDGRSYYYYSETLVSRIS